MLVVWDFLFESCQYAPRGKLLEFMANANDIEHLRTLGQRDLAITCAERMGSAFEAKADAKGKEPTAAKDAAAAGSLVEGSG